MYKYYCDLIIDNIPFSSNYEDVLHFKNDEERNEFYSFISEENNKQINFNRSNGKSATAVAFLNDYYFYENKNRVENPSLSQALNIKYARVKEINDEINETKYYFYFVENIEILNSNAIKLFLQIDIFTTYTGLFENFTNKVQIERYCCDRFTADSTPSNLNPNWSAMYLKTSESIVFPKNNLNYYTLNFDITNKSKEQNPVYTTLTEDEAIILLNKFANFTYDYYFVQENNKIIVYVGSNDKIQISENKPLPKKAWLNSDLLFQYIQKNKSAQLLASYTTHVPPYFFFDSYINNFEDVITKEKWVILYSISDTGFNQFEDDTSYGYLTFEKPYKEMTVNRSFQSFNIDFKIDLDFEPKKYANADFFDYQMRINSSTFDFSISQFETNIFKFRNLISITASNYLETSFIMQKYAPLTYRIGVSTENSYSIEMLGDNFQIWQSNNKNWQKQFILSNTISTTSQILGIGASFVTNPLLGISSTLGSAVNVGTNLFNKKFEIEDIKNSPSTLISSGSNFYFDSIGNLNKTEILTRTLTDDFSNYLDDYFKRYGYSTNEFINPSECLIRSKFNYIQMNLKSHNELPSINMPRIIEDELFSIFNKGIRIWEINDNTKKFIFDFSQSNYEKRLENE